MSVTGLVELLHQGVLDHQLLCLCELAPVEYNIHSDTCHDMEYKNQKVDYHNS